MRDHALSALRDWAATTTDKTALAEVFLFGSLVKQGGVQFDPVRRSDIDLLAVLPAAADTPLARVEAVRALIPRKEELETRLIRLFRIKDNNKKVVSLLPITRQECDWSVHKSKSVDLLRATDFHPLPQGALQRFGQGFDAEARLTLEYAFAILAECQGYRHQMVHVTTFGEGGPPPWDEAGEPMPKELMRWTAQLRYLESGGAGDDPHDVNKGLASVDALLDPWDSQGDEYRALHNILTVRKGGMGEKKPLEPHHLLLYREILAQGAMALIDKRAVTVRRTSPSPPPEPDPVDLAPWLERLLDKTGKLEIRGIGSGAGRNREAGRYDIEALYTPMRSRGEGMARDAVNLAALLARKTRLLIEGQPGAGKTTFVRLAAAMLCRDHLGITCPTAASWRQGHLGLDDGRPPLLPLFLRLSELAALLAEDKPHTQVDDARRLLDLLDAGAKPEDPAAWRRHWNAMLSQGKVMVLLDGLDEVAEETLRTRVIRIVQDAVRQWKTCPLVVTSRPFGVEQMKGLGFHHAVIEPFNHEEIRRFLALWSNALYEQSGGEVMSDHRETLGQAILEKPAIRRLAANPVMLTCLCVVHWNEGKLPEGRARVYQAVICWLIASRSEMRRLAGYGDRFALEALAALALAMMTGAKARKRAVFDVEDGAEAVLPVVARHSPELQSKPERLRWGRDWLRFECLGSGIVEELGDKRLKFWHLTFQEYLAAQALAWRGDGEQPGEDFWPVLQDRLADPQWRETIELFPGALFDEGGHRRVDRLLQRVLDDRQPGLADDARVAGIMGRLLAPMSVYQYKPPEEIAKTYQTVLDHALAIFTREGAARVPINDRIPAAEALGRGGDPRLEGNNLIEVPGTGWRLGKYLVTVQEYQKFVEHGGYDDPQWWKEGWAVRTKEGWSEPSGWDEQTEHPNRPITGVSWFEAMAYCRWLSGQRGETIRLPTEALWQQAATPPQGDYPWGAAKPTPELANYDEGRVGAPTPVGLYPAGDGPRGHCDLAGNVLEWQRNLYEDEDATATPLDPAVTAGDMPVLRGGAWVRSAGCLRSACRDGHDAPFRDVHLGFRVAVAPASR